MNKAIIKKAANLSQKKTVIIAIVIGVFFLFLLLSKIPEVNALVRTFTSGNSATITSVRSKKILRVSMASTQGCIVAIDQYVYCAGLNSSGQLGDGTTSNATTPSLFKMPTGVGVTNINTVHNNFTCALGTNQLAYCTGVNTNGQLGDATIVNKSTPVLYKTPAGKTVDKIIPSFYYYYTCALTTDQLVYCAGENLYGQLGDATSGTDRSTPVLFQLPAGKFAKDFAMGLYATCVYTVDQLIYCAGNNVNGALADNSTTSRSTPVLFQVPAGKIATAVDLAYNHTCILTDDQLVYCTGLNSSGQLGDTTLTNRSLPVLFQLPAGKTALSIEVNRHQTCALTVDKAVYCAGLNTDGQLGNGNILNRSTPALFQLPAGKYAQSVSSTYLHTCVLTTDQAVYCSGDNTYGQLGDNTSGTDRFVPVLFQLPAGKKAESVSTSYYQSCVKTIDQLIYCAGSNANGQLGDGVPVANKPLPTSFVTP